MLRLQIAAYHLQVYTYEYKQCFLTLQYFEDKNSATDKQPSTSSDVGVVNSEAMPTEATPTTGASDSETTPTRRKRKREDSEQVGTCTHCIVYVTSVIMSTCCGVPSIRELMGGTIKAILSYTSYTIAYGVIKVVKYPPNTSLGTAHQVCIL